MNQEITRREFIKYATLTGAAVALAGCGTPPHQALVSQLELPEYRLPGEPKWFATTCQECSGGCGVSVRVIDGRAKKIEGIPEHPINHGKVCARGHSSLQALYNPDRLSSILKKQGGGWVESQDWDETVKVLASQLNQAAARKGSMLWITRSLSGTSGAVLIALAQKVGAKIWVLDFPGAQSQRTAMKGLIGKAELPYYDIRRADYVVNFGSDLFTSGNLPVHDAWQYGEFRQGKGRALRGILVSLSSRMNLTDANSDKWIPVRPGTEGWVAMGLGNLIARSKKGNWPAWASEVTLEKISKISGVEVDVFGRLARRLLQAKRPVVIAGVENGNYSNGTWSISMIQMLNRSLGGKINSFEPSLLPSIAGLKEVPANLLVSTQEALGQLRKGNFESIWVLDADPRYLLPIKLNFENEFSKAKNKIVFSPFPNETSLLADWVIPTRTWYESWGDRLTHGPFGENGKAATVYNLQQPVVQERSGSQSIADLLLRVVGQAGGSLASGWPANTLQGILKSRYKSKPDWENLLVRGGAWESHSLDWELYLGDHTHPSSPPPLVKGTAKAPSGVNPWGHLKKANLDGASLARISGKGQVLIPFYSMSLADGSPANRPWMQELPDPLTTVTWTHWVELPVTLAKRLGVERGDVVRLSSPGGGTLEGPAYPNPALHEEAVAVPVGQGHTHYGRYADRGANPLSILDPVWQDDTGELAWVGTRVEVEKVGTKARMTTQDQRVDAYPREFMPL